METKYSSCQFEIVDGILMYWSRKGPKKVLKRSQKDPEKVPKNSGKGPKKVPKSSRKWLTSWVLNFAWYRLLKNSFIWQPRVNLSVGQNLRCWTISASGFWPWWMFCLSLSPHPPRSKFWLVLTALLWFVAQYIVHTPFNLYYRKLLH